MMKQTSVKLYPTTTAFLVEYDNGQVKVTTLNVADAVDPQQAEANRAELEDALNDDRWPHVDKPVTHLTNLDDHIPF